MIKKKTLKNGLRIIYNKTNTQSVTIIVSVKAGCVYEKDSLMGASHFVEHMLFNGTKNRTQHQILTEIEDLGGELNASTTNDRTTFYIKIIKKHFLIALDVISDMILNSTMPKTLFGREKKIILDEINMVFDNPRHYQFILFHEALFKDHEAKKRVLGTEETIGQISRKDLFDYYKEYYIPKNMVVSIAGDIPLVMDHVSKKFENMENNGMVHKKLSEQPNHKGKVLIKRKMSQTYNVLGYSIPKRSDPKSVVFDVIGSILGRGQSGWIFDEVRNKRGLAYDVGVYVDSTIDFGIFCVYVNCHKDKLKKVKDIIFNQFERIQKLTQSELKKIKTYIEGEFIMANEDTEKLAEETAFFEFSSNAKDFENYIESINNVTLKQVKEISKKYLNDNYSEATIEQTDK